MSRFLRIVSSIFVLAVFMAAIWLLHRELRQYQYRDIKNALQAIPIWRIGLAVGLTALNYVVLAGYDWLAVRYLQHPLTLGKIAMASFIGHVSSFNFGAVLGGPSVRYRLYSTWGLSTVEIFKLIALSTITFWTGYLLLAGVVFVVEPVPVPQMLHLPINTVPLGIGLLLLVSAYLLLGALNSRPLRWGDWEFPVPPARFSLAQMGVSATDLVIACTTLYVLMPESLDVDFGRFLSIYLMAVISVLFTHVPGGLGVLEVVILLLLAPREPAAVMGALLAYRLVYYLLPLLAASLLLAGYELTLRREAVGRLAGAVGRWAPSVAPRVLSFVMLVAGAIMLCSGALPAAHGRLSWLNDFLPLPIIEVSHFLGSISGLALILLAHGLQHRLDSAYLLTAIVLVAGMVFSLLKGFDYEETILLAVLLAVLLPCHRYFYRRTALLHDAWTPGWVATIAAVIVCATWLGLFAFKHVEYSNDLWWRFAIQGDAPRALRAGVGVAAVVLTLGLARMLSYAEPKPRVASPDELRSARVIVEASPTAYGNLALTGDKCLLFNESRTAMLMYAVSHRSWVALGDPVGPSADHSELAWRFRELSEYYGGWPVFYKVDHKHLSLYLELGLSLLKIGEEARVWLADFVLQSPERRFVREVHDRLERQGCELEVARLAASPALLPELKRISDDWLANQQRMEKGFCMGKFDAEYLQQTPVAVVRVGSHVVAFGNLLSGTQSEELGVDMLRFSREAPDGVVDYLLAQLMLWARQEGYRWFSLGMAPLPSDDNDAGASRRQPLGDMLTRHGELFYQFPGLRRDKQKYAPVWAPKYLAAPGGVLLPRILSDLERLIMDEPSGVASD